MEVSKYFFNFAVLFYKNAQVAELVDALDSKSSDFGRVGSIPTLSTRNPDKQMFIRVLLFFRATNRGTFHVLFKTSFNRSMSINLIVNINIVIIGMFNLESYFFLGILPRSMRKYF